MITQSELSQALTGVAQGAINISEGLTTIEKGSRVCQGMETLAISHRLIEAAPEMLEALVEAQGVIYPLTLVEGKNAQEVETSLCETSAWRIGPRTRRARKAYLRIRKAIANATGWVWEHSIKQGANWVKEEGR
tara:strand:+ start:1031 stop:1432 length:402 start_codon:yes stop_codon:yes gene_type:complete